MRTTHWRECRIGSCLRHQACMYVPCRATAGRNAEIFRASTAGESLSSLAREHGISVTRIRQIVETAQRRANRGVKHG